MSGVKGLNIFVLSGVLIRHRMWSSIAHHILSDYRRSSIETNNIKRVVSFVETNST